MNALKYATSIPVILFGPLLNVQPQYLGLWIALSMVNCIYTLAWDLLVDWELNEGRKAFIFPLWIYLTAGCVNALLRMTWIWTLLNDDRSAEFAFVLQILEIVRRFIWLIFRVESQQLQADSTPVPLAEL